MVERMVCDAMQPVLVALEDRTLGTRHQGLTLPMAIVEQEEPAVVVVLIVERSLPPGGPRPR